MKQIADGCYQLKLGAVNAYLIESDEGLALVDTGFPGSEHLILSAIAGLGHQPSDLKHIVLTHAHPDHVGSAAALVLATGATTYMHEADIAVASGRAPVRPIHAFTGLWSRIMYAVIRRSGPAIWTPVEIDIGLQDGDVLPFGGIRVIHTPGHCAGHVALLWPDRLLLFAADACVHYVTLRPPAVGENEAVAMESLRRLSSERFDVAAFGHGRVIKAGADRQFRRLVENG